MNKSENKLKALNLIKSTYMRFEYEK